MPEKAQLLRADRSPSPQPTVQKARLSDVSEMFRLVNYYAERQQMLPKTQLQLYENLRDYSVAVGTSNAPCFSQTCDPGTAGVSPDAAYCLAQHCAQRAPSECGSLLPLLKTAQYACFSRIRLKAAASCRTPKVSPCKKYATLGVSPADCSQSPFPGEICAAGPDAAASILEPPGRRRSQDKNHAALVGTSASQPLLGCGALHIYWENLAEIRALAVAPEMTHRGVGTALVERLLDEARELEIEQVFLFTYEPRFFAHFGFIQVEHRTLPLKVYNECFHCPKFNKCDELAMVLHL
jgi:amino-acid N-acetyltransferase